MAPSTITILKNYSIYGGVDFLILYTSTSPYSEYVIGNILYLFSNKILIKREDSEK